MLRSARSRSRRSTPPATGPSTPRSCCATAARGDEPVGGADRRLAVRRRRRATRPRGRARARARASSTARCTSACSRSPTTSRSGPATSAARLCGSAALDHQSLVDDRLRARAQPRRSSSPTPTEFVEPTRSHASATGRPTSSTSSRSTAARWSRSSALRRRSAPRAVEVAIAEGALLVDARTNEQFDEAHIPGAISASAYDTGFATKVAKVVPADVELIVVAASDGYELDGRRPARLGRPAGARLPRRRDDRLALGGPAGQPHRADRPRRARRAARRRRGARSSSTSATLASSRRATSPARSTSRTASSRDRAGELPSRPADRGGLQRRQAQRASPLRSCSARASSA